MPVEGIAAAAAKSTAHIIFLSRFILLYCLFVGRCCEIGRLRECLVYGALCARHTKGVAVEQAADVGVPYNGEFVFLNCRGNSVHKLADDGAGAVAVEERVGVVPAPSSPVPIAGIAVPPGTGTVVIEIIGVVDVA